MVVGCWCLVVGVWLSGCLVVCLEDSTEQSESNPGRSLGIITEESCLEDSTLCCAPSPSAQSARAQKVHG